MTSELRGRPGVMTFADTLAMWLPAQRWYSGTGTKVRDLAIPADTTLAAGDPELRHLVITVSQNGEAARYQVLAGIRAHVPEQLRRAVIGPTGSGGTAYDPLHDPVLTPVLLRGISDPLTARPLRLRREPDAVLHPRADHLATSG